MSKPTFVYVIYIAATPTKVWQALFDGGMTRLYWRGPTVKEGVENISDWKPGSRWEARRCDQGRAVVGLGDVLESEPPRRLVMTWVKPEDASAAEKYSRVTFEIEPQGEKQVRLTVIHEDLKDPIMAEKVSEGWPMVLSNLKTLLETGHALPPSPWSA